MCSELPVIDFSLFDGDRKQFARRVDDALRGPGSFLLRNHGIPRQTIDNCFNGSKRFFKDLSEKEKKNVSMIPGSYNQGYVGVEQEQIRGVKVMKENFDFGDPNDDSINIWPPEAQLPGFRATSTDFHKHCSQLINQLLECLSIALELDPAESLGHHHDGSMFVSSLLHYPTVPAQLVRSGNVTRSPAHADFGTLTLLFQPEIGGLQVADMSSTDETTSAAVNENAKFFDVEPDSDAILVIVGHMLMRWTNYRYKHTVHRVVEPPVDSIKAHKNEDSGMVPARFSIAFFSFPNTETTVEPFRNCYSDNGKNKRWKPINAGEYLAKKRGTVYSGLPSRVS